MSVKFYNVNEAQLIGDALGVDWGKIELSEFHLGINIELEESDDGKRNDMEVGKITLSNLEKNPNYYKDMK